MNPFIETGALVVATIIVGITILCVPVPKQKPPEIDKPPPAVEVPPPPPPAMTPQEIVQPPQDDAARMREIEQKLLHIQAQVQRMEGKVK